MSDLNVNLAECIKGKTLRSTLSEKTRVDTNMMNQAYLMFPDII